jgi:hypothetical protein
MLFLLLATAALPPVHAHAQEQSANEAAQPSEAPQAETGGDAVVVSAGAPGDWIEADSGSYLTGDKLELRGNVILHTESAFPGAVIEIRADLAIWDEKSGIFSVPGTTSISVPTYELELHGEDLSVNMGKRTGSLDAVDGTLHFDPKMFADENGMVNRQYVRFTTDDPVVSLISEGMSFVTNADGKLLFTFKRARLAPTDAASADFRIAVQEMLYTPGEQVIISNARMQASGMSVAYVPRFRYKLKSSNRAMHGTVPMPGYDEDDGLFIQQSEYWRRGDLAIDLKSEFFIQDQRYLPDVNIYTKPSETSALGVHFGRDRTRDLYRRRVSRSTNYDFYFKQNRAVDWPGVRRISYGVNYAKRRQDVPKLSSRSLGAYAEAQSKPLDLGGGVKAMGVFGAHYWDYDYGDSEFLALQSILRIARESPWGIDYVQYEHADKFGGSPFRFDDQFTENKLTANKNFQLLPHYTGRVTAAYNYDLNNFDELTVGLSRELRMYYVGMNYNFARASAGVEFALKF